MFGFGGFNCGNCKWSSMRFRFQKFSCPASVYMLWFFSCSLQVDCSGCVARRGRTAPHPRHCTRRHLSQVTFSLNSSKLAHAIVQDNLMTFVYFQGKTRMTSTRSSLRVETCRCPRTQTSPRVTVHPWSGAGRR